jgi:hypothetical protein
VEAEDENESHIKCNGKAQQGLLMENHYDVDRLFDPSCSMTESHLISQADLSDFVCDLNLSRNESRLLASRLDSWKLLEKAPRNIFLPQASEGPFISFVSPRQFSVL